MKQKNHPLKKTLPKVRLKRQNLMARLALGLLILSATALADCDVPLIVDPAQPSDNASLTIDTELIITPVFSQSSTCAE